MQALGCMFLPSLAIGVWSWTFLSLRFLFLPSLLLSFLPSSPPFTLYSFFLLSILREEFSVLCLPSAGITDMLHKLFVLDLKYVAITFSLPCPRIFCERVKKQKMESCFIKIYDPSHLIYVLQVYILIKHGPVLSSLNSEKQLGSMLDNLGCPQIYFLPFITYSASGC